MVKNIWLFALLFVFTTSWANEKIVLLPHQEAPIDYLVEHPEIKGLLINHYMGTGKTFLAIGFAERFPEKPVVILAPRFIEGHWLSQIKQFGVKDMKRFEFVSYHDAPRILKNRDLSNTIVVVDEAHNLVRFIKSSNQEQNKQYSELFLALEKSGRILALTGTPLYNSEHDLAPLVNLVSGKEIFPYNEEEFRLKYTGVIPCSSFWRGYFTESMIIRNASPMVVGLATASFLSGVLVAPVMALGMISFPVINAFLPPEKFHLRFLDTDKLKPITSEYVSYYEIPNLDKSEFPTQNRHIIEVNYDSEQFQIFLDFAEMSLDDKHLMLLLKEESPNIDPAYLKLNSTGLQKHLRNSSGAGRDIGNIGMAPPKFDELFKIINSKGLQKTVIYSNYYENGILSFARYLDSKGLSDAYAILRPDAKAEEQTRVVTDYNSGKTQILLLHPEITEGISLKGTRQFHIMEPVLNQTILEQVIARAVRYKSHSHLPTAEREVNVYLWKSVVGSFNLKKFELKKKDWLKRYRELSDWSDFGRGIIQIDKNYYFKMYSPDEFVYLKLGDLNKNMTALKSVLKKNSIETGSSLEHAEVESKPLPYPTTNFTLGYFFTPEINWLGNDRLQKMPKMRSDFSYRIGFEVPLYRYLNAGAYVGFARYQFQDQKEGALLNFGTGLDLKTQIPIAFGNQRLAPYLTGSLGIDALIDVNTISQFSKLKDGNVSTTSGPLGFGAQGGLMAGFEYYPVPLVGIFIEGGMQGLLGLHRIEKTTEITEKHSWGGSSSSSHSEETWDFNIYLLRSWQLQFGLKLGF